MSDNLMSNQDPTVLSSLVIRDPQEKCPRRMICVQQGLPAASVGDSSSVERSVSMVGLGCSSFSTFFDESPAAAAAAGSSAWRMRDTMKKSNVRVQTWIETIRYAILNCGINLLDTAPWYGHGTSEIVIGFAMQDLLIENDHDGTNHNTMDHKTTTSSSKPRQRVSRSDLIINTKVGRYEADPSQQFDFSYHRTIASTRESLRRMECQYVDVLQLHDPEFSPSISLLLEETIPAMLHCQAQGWVRALGITGYPLDVQHEIMVESQKRFGTTIVWNQSLTYSHCNLHDLSLFQPQFPLPNNDDDNDQEEKRISFADFCKVNGITLLAAAPLSMGLLTPLGPPDWHPALPELKEACRKAAEICANLDVDIATLALLYAFSQEIIPCTILGMSNVQQVEQAMNVASRLKGGTAPLSDVLTSNEKRALEQLRDSQLGPFARVWADKTYFWDGVKEADTFWNLVPGGKIEAERRMRKRDGSLS